MCNGTKTSWWDCSIAVLWDLVAYRKDYENFYDFCDSMNHVPYNTLEAVLDYKGIKVIFY